jgi:hypothetical protein
MAQEEQTCHKQDLNLGEEDNNSSSQPPELDPIGIQALFVGCGRNKNDKIYIAKVERTGFAILVNPAGH